MTWGNSAGNMPGFTPRIDTEQVQLRARVEGNNNPITTRDVVVDSTVTDSGNTPTSTIRGGTIMAIKTSDGNAYIYDPDAIDGTQTPVGVLQEHLSMLQNGSAADKIASLIDGGVIKETSLINLDEAARGHLEAMGLHIYPDGGAADVSGAYGLNWKGQKSHSSNVTLTAADSGFRHVATAAVNFTLPTIAKGLRFEFLQTADANMVVTGDSNVIGVNNAAASTVTFSTSNEKIGARVRVEAIYVGSTLKWIVEFLSAATAALA